MEIDLDKNPMLELEPFQAWLIENREKYSSDDAFAKALSISTKTLRTYTTGEINDRRRKASNIDEVHVSVVDKCAVKMEDHISNIYAYIYS